MATHHLASWAHNLLYSDLPQDVVRAAIKTFYNWAGCAVGGSDHPAATIARSTLTPFFGQPTASLLGTSYSVDAQHAALLNGIASHVHDYDDTHLDTIIHPAGPVASALLAVAQWKGGFSGKEFLLALIVGIEAECKLGLSVWPEHYDVGWHITSTTGSIGAAVAVSKLLGLSIQQTSHAIGIAATQVTGLREMFGAHTKSFHPGRAAQNGLMAAIMAQGGYTSSLQALEAKRGWANVIGATKPDVQANMDKWLGIAQETHGVGLPVGAATGRWEILRNSFKPFPCGIVIHPVIDACSRLHVELEARGLAVGDIQSVHATVHPLVLELTGKAKPRDGLEGKFSFYHGGAIGLLYGKGTPAQYEDAVVQDPEVIATRDRIRGTADSSLAADEARVVLTMNDGEVLQSHVLHAVGSLEVPMGDEALEAKFIDQCSSVLGDGVHAASQACWAIVEAEDVASISKALCTC
ncbi:hypothetical protein UA08_02494 [Talaromyces atroroseus]|uniref:Uncharacterized protein n=1 Tax=Talaromyces atroroseus TaxID=1441469 RepID=A0A225AS11_TALAT|nr:hypothetical protein UA08_02494 [Talaromyces atroroseus]OKL62283.1 hypothetical protein UA08_02494 [Talaromyces atroroseus]